jgi:hypothetical protein
VNSGTNISDLCDGSGNGYFVGDKDSSHEPLICNYKIKKYLFFVKKLY